MMAHSTLGGGAQEVPISQEYLNRGAYISKRFRGNQGFINAAKALAAEHSSYGMFPGQHVCSTFNAAAINRAGYTGWYGIGPNSQARGGGFSQFHITKIYGRDE